MDMYNLRDQKRWISKGDGGIAPEIEGMLIMMGISGLSAEMMMYPLVVRAKCR
jgi:hypothetical protein